MSRSNNSPSKLKATALWRERKALAARDAGRKQAFDYAQQIFGFKENLRLRGLSVNELYKHIYRAIVLSLDTRCRKEDFFTLYEIGLRECVSEATVLKYLKLFNDDFLFDRLFVRGNQVFISLRLFNQRNMN